MALDPLKPVFGATGVMTTAVQNNPPKPVVPPIQPIPQGVSPEILQIGAKLDAERQQQIVPQIQPQGISPEVLRIGVALDRERGIIPTQPPVPMPQAAALAASAVAPPVQQGVQPPATEPGFIGRSMAAAGVGITGFAASKLRGISTLPGVPDETLLKAADWIDYLVDPETVQMVNNLTGGQLQMTDAWGIIKQLPKIGWYGFLQNTPQLFDAIIANKVGGAIGGALGALAGPKGFVAGKVIGGPAMGMASAGLTEAGSFKGAVMPALRAQGIDEETANMLADKYARMYGPAAGVIEYSSNMFQIGKATKGMRKSAIDTLRKTPIWKLLLDPLTGGLSEGGEELSQGWLHRQAENLMWAEAEKITGRKLERPEQDDLRKQGITGFAVGVIMGAMGLPVNIASRSAQNRQAAELKKQDFATYQATLRDNLVSKMGLPAELVDQSGIVNRLSAATSDAEYTKILNDFTDQNLAPPPPTAAQVDLAASQPKEVVLPPLPREGAIAAEGIPEQGLAEIEAQKPLEQPVLPTKEPILPPPAPTSEKAAIAAGPRATAQPEAEAGALISEPEVIPISRELKITNLDALPRGTGARYLEVIRGEDDTLVAKQWRRKPVAGAVMVDMEAKPAVPEAPAKPAEPITKGEPEAIIKRVEPEAAKFIEPTPHEFPDTELRHGDRVYTAEGKTGTVIGKSPEGNALILVHDTNEIEDSGESLVGEVPPELEGDIKEVQDAIRKSRAEKVDVRKLPEDGGAVGETHAKGEGVAGTGKVKRPKKAKRLTPAAQRKQQEKEALDQLEDSNPIVQSVLEDGGITPSKFLVGTGIVQTGPRKGYPRLRPAEQEEYQEIDKIFQHRKGEKGGQSLDEAASKLNMTAEELRSKLSDAALEYRRILAYPDIRQQYEDSVQLEGEIEEIKQQFNNDEIKIASKIVRESRRQRPLARQPDLISESDVEFSLVGDRAMTPEMVAAEEARKTRDAQAQAQAQAEKQAQDLPFMPPPVKVERAQAKVEQYTANWKNKPKGGIIVVQSEDQADTFNLSNDSLRAIHDRKAEGFYHIPTDTVVIIADNLSNPIDAVRVAIHEATVHSGLRGLFGNRFETELEKIGKDIPDADLTEIALTYELDMSKPADRLEAYEEYLGKRAETRNPALWDRFVMAVKRALRAMGIDENIIDLFDRRGDIDRIIDAGREYVERGHRLAPLARDEGVRMSVRRGELGENIDRQRIMELGYTADIREAGYITPDGKLIDLSGKKEGGEPGKRSFDHREAGGTAGMQEFGAEGNIRIDYNSGILDIYVAPTKIQEEIIERFIKSRDIYFVVDLQKGLGEKSEDHYRNSPTYVSKEYDAGTKPRKILNDIRAFYGGEGVRYALKEGARVPEGTAKADIGTSLTWKHSKARLSETLSPADIAALDKWSKYQIAHHKESDTQAMEAFKKEGPDEVERRLFQDTESFPAPVRVRVAEMLAELHASMAEKTDNVDQQNQHKKRIFEIVKQMTTRGTELGQEVESYKGLWQRMLTMPGGAQFVHSRRVADIVKAKVESLPVTVAEIASEAQKAKAEAIDEVMVSERVQAEVDKILERLGATAWQKLEKTWKYKAEAFVASPEHAKYMKMDVRFAATLSLEEKMMVAVHWGADYLSSSRTLSYGDWSAKMKARFGEGIMPQLRRVWNQIGIALDAQGKAKAPTVSKEAKPKAERKRQPVILSEEMKRQAREWLAQPMAQPTIQEATQVEYDTTLTETMRQPTLPIQKTILNSLEELGLTRKEAFVFMSELQRDAFKKEQVRQATRLKQLLRGKPISQVDASVAKRLMEISSIRPLTDESIVKALAEKLGMPDLTEAQLAKMEELAERVRKAPVGTPQYEATRSLLGYIEDQLPLVKGEVIWSMWYANMLSGYQTHERNVISTWANVTANLAISMAVDPKNAPFALSGFISGIKKGWREAKHTVQTGEMPVHIVAQSKLEATSVLERGPFKGFAKVFNNWKYVMRLMVAEDAIFFKPAQEQRAMMIAADVARAEGLSGRLLWSRVAEIMGRDAAQVAEFEAQAKAEGYTGYQLQRRMDELAEMVRPESLMQQAVDYAQRGTFNYQPEGMAGIIGQKVREASRSVPLVRVIIPFTQIVANVTNITLDYSPWGFMRAIKGMRQIGGKKRAIVGHERASLLAKATIGSTAMIAAYALDRLNAGDDDDEPGWFAVFGKGSGESRKDNQMRERGWRPWSIKLGKYYVDYRLTPLAIPLGIIGSVRDAERWRKLEEKDIATRLGFATLRSLSVVTDMSFMSGMTQFLEMLNVDSAEQAARLGRSFIARSTVGAAVPNFFKQLDRTFDPNLRDSSNFLEACLREIPIASRLAGPRLNVLGEPVKQRIGPVSLVLGKEIGTDPVWNLIVKNEAWISVPSNRQYIYGGRRERRMTENEFYSFIKYRGEFLREIIERNLSRMEGRSKARINEDIGRYTIQARDKAKSRVRRENAEKGIYE
jgi:hypothetical protein